MHRKVQASSEVDIPTWNFFMIGMIVFGLMRPLNVWTPCTKDVSTNLNNIFSKPHPSQHEWNKDSLPSPEMASEHWPLNTRKHDRLHGSMAPNLRSTSSLSSKTNRPKNTKTQGARSTHGGCPPQALKQTNMHQARKAAISAEKSAADHWSVSLIVFDQEHHTRQTLSLQQFSNHTGFPRDGKKWFSLVLFFARWQKFCPRNSSRFGSRKTDPKKGIHSVSIWFACVRAAWPRFGSVSGLQNGDRFVGKICPARKIGKFQIFPRVRDKGFVPLVVPWFCRTTSTCSPPHMFLKVQEHVWTWKCSQGVCNMLAGQGKIQALMLEIESDAGGRLA